MTSAAPGRPERTSAVATGTHTRAVPSVGTSAARKVKPQRGRPRDTEDHVSRARHCRLQQRRQPDTEEKSAPGLDVSVRETTQDPRRYDRVFDEPPVGALPAGEERVRGAHEDDRADHRFGRGSSDGPDRERRARSVLADQGRDLLRSQVREVDRAFASAARDQRAQRQRNRCRS